MNVLYNDSKDKVCSLLYDKINLNDPDFEGYLLETLEREKKFSRIELISICNHTVALEDLDEIQLCILFQKTALYYKEIGNVTDYFTSIEIEQAKNIIIKPDDMVYPIVFDNVMEINENQYSVKMPVQLIKRLQDSKLLIRIQEAQRESFIKIKNDESFPYIKTSRKNIVEIRDSILANDYDPDEMKYNLIKTDDSNMVYDEDNHTLTINEGTLAITDGNHRTIAICEALEKNPNIELNFNVTVTHHPVWKMKNTINQQEKKQAMKREHVAQMASTKENQIVEKIKNNENLSTVLRGKIVTTNDHVRRGQGLVVATYLADAIKAVYSNEETGKYSDRTIMWLVEFFNYLFYIFEEKIQKITIVKQKTWMLDEVAIFVYVYLSKHLQDDENWQEKLEKYVNKIDFVKAKSPKGIYGKKTNLAAKKYVGDEILND